jgi:hypothetical protein
VICKCSSVGSSIKDGFLGLSDFDIDVSVVGSMLGSIPKLSNSSFDIGDTVPHVCVLDRAQSNSDLEYSHVTVRLPRIDDERAEVPGKRSRTWRSETQLIYNSAA